RIRAAELAQLLQLLPSLDALCHYLDIEMPRHGDDGFDDRQVAHVRDEVTHEAAIDLEVVHPPLLEVREARVAGAEVIDGDADAEVPQPRNGVLGGLAVAAL